MQMVWHVGGPNGFDTQVGEERVVQVLRRGAHDRGRRRPPLHGGHDQNSAQAGDRRGVGLRWRRLATGTAPSPGAAGDAGLDEISDDRASCAAAATGRGGRTQLAAGRSPRRLPGPELTAHGASSWASAETLPARPVPAGSRAAVEVSFEVVPGHSGGRHDAGLPIGCMGSAVSPRRAPASLVAAGERVRAAVWRGRAGRDVSTRVRAGV